MVLNTTLFKNNYEEEDAILTNTLSGLYENRRVTTLGSFAFYNQQHITELSLPNAVTINQYACANLSSCSKITLNWSNITTINQYAFRSCSAWIESINCNATTIASFTFLGCIGITGVSLPNCTTIGSQAFNNCNHISYLSLPSCTAAQQSAFQSCYSLTSVYSPVLNAVQAGTFRYCSKLLFVSFPSALGIQATGMANCTSLSSVYLPLGNYLYSSALQDCPYLSMVILSGTTDGTISAVAFQRDYRLLSLYLLGSVVKPLANVTAFANTPISTNTTYTDGVRGSIFVPSSLYASYIAATNWTTYSARFVSMTDQEIEDFLGGL